MRQNEENFNSLWYSFVTLWIIHDLQSVGRSFVDEVEDRWNLLIFLENLRTIQRAKQKNEKERNKVQDRCAFIPQCNVICSTRMKERRQGEPFKVSHYHFYHISPPSYSSCSPAPSSQQPAENVCCQDERWGWLFFLLIFHMNERKNGMDWQNWRWGGKKGGRVAKGWAARGWGGKMRRVESLRAWMEKVSCSLNNETLNNRHSMHDQMTFFFQITFFVQTWFNVFHFFFLI